MYLDANLPSDIKDPESIPIVPYTVIERQIRIFRALLGCYIESGVLPTNVSPPGSVFLLPSLSGQYFDFQHSFTCGCIGINIGEFYLAASLWDFQLAKEAGYFDWVWAKKNYSAPPSYSSPEEVASWYHHIQSVWLCNLGCWSFRWNINMFRINKYFQPTEPAFEGPPLQRAEDAAELTSICRTFGLELAKFELDGKSTFGPGSGRGGASRIYGTRIEH
jgi:hypothetical protein